MTFEVIFTWDGHNQNTCTSCIASIVPTLSGERKGEPGINCVRMCLIERTWLKFEVYKYRGSSYSKSVKVVYLHKPSRCPFTRRSVFIAYINKHVIIESSDDKPSIIVSLYQVR